MSRNSKFKSIWSYKWADFLLMLVTHLLWHHSNLARSWPITIPAVPLGPQAKARPQRPRTARPVVRRFAQRTAKKAAQRAGKQNGKRKAQRLQERWVNIGGIVGWVIYGYHGYLWVGYFFLNLGESILRHASWVGHLRSATQEMRFTVFPRKWSGP